MQHSTNSKRISHVNLWLTSFLLSRQRPVIGSILYIYRINCVTRLYTNGINYLIKKGFDNAFVISQHILIGARCHASHRLQRTVKNNKKDKPSPYGLFLDFLVGESAVHVGRTVDLWALRDTRDWEYIYRPRHSRRIDQRLNSILFSIRPDRFDKR